MHTLKSQLKHENAHNTNIKIPEGMFFQASHRLQVGAV